jgi:hypothetical protein
MNPLQSRVRDANAVPEAAGQETESVAAGA